MKFTLRLKVCEGKRKFIFLPTSPLFIRKVNFIFSRNDEDNDELNTLAYVKIVKMKMEHVTDGWNEEQ